MADAWWAWYSQFPPIARTAAPLAFVTSFCVWNGFISAKWVVSTPVDLFQWPPALLQLLTYFTNFLVTGPKIGMIMDAYWLYRWVHKLEADSSRFNTKADFVWYLLVVTGFIHVLNYLFVGRVVLQQGLLLALCYTACQDARGELAGLFFFTFPAQYMPLAQMALSFLMNPDDILTLYLMVAGVVSAHLYDFLTRIYPEFGGGPNLLPTPRFCHWLVNTPQVIQRTYGTAIRAPEQASATTTGSNTSRGPLPDSWRTRGPGHRLGGE